MEFKPVRGAYWCRTQVYLMYSLHETRAPMLKWGVTGALVFRSHPPALGVRQLMFRPDMVPVVW